MAENSRMCSTCSTANQEDARFCENCGDTLARPCGNCGVQASATAKFCRACGAPLDTIVTHGTAGPVRKTVTVLFADLAGSTTFEEQVDAETAREVMARYHDLLRSTADRHRAGTTKYIGDGFMALWGVPEIGPDDASQAVEAATELQELFVEIAASVADTHGVGLALRVAVNTGEVVVGADDADLVGDALNVGARLESECPLGRVVVGEETWRSTRGRYGYESLGQVQVKGRTAPVAVYQLSGRQPETTDAAPFVGRGDEKRRLQAAVDDAVAARAARLVTVIGDPGVGKSRLAAEFTGSQTSSRVIEARCTLEGTVALAPIADVLRTRDLETDIPAGISERDRLLRDLNGMVAGVPGSVEETFWALRRFIEVLAGSAPVLLVLDDIQWADTLLLDFIEHLIEWVRQVPVLVLALARPELRESRPDLVTVGQWASEAIHLGGLDAGATAELAANVLGAVELPNDLLRRLPSSTGGNPLFVREFIGMLADDGVLVEESTGWRLTIDVDAITIPPTIHALLASRLERLDDTDRRLLEIASVVGSDFSLGAVRALAGNIAAGLTLSLNRLRRLELAQPSGTYVGDEPVWRFHHMLIRDVAYRRLLKSDRADLHERLADWVVAGGLTVAVDPDEMAARHLEVAYTYRTELGIPDTGHLALRSARHYAASARRALDRDELVSAGTQAARGATLAATDVALQSELLLTGSEAFLSAGDVTACAPLVDDLERIADDALAPWATCYRCQLVVYTDPERLPELDARLQVAIDEFTRRADQAGLAKAYRVRASARARLGRVGDMEVDLFEALIAARQSGDHRQITAALGAAPGAALWGPSPVPKAGGRCLDVVRMQRMTTAAPSLEATSLRHLAILELLRGRPDKARTMLAEARQVVADLGLRHGLMETELFAGFIELMEGDPAAAEPHFRKAREGLSALGAGVDVGQAAALLARSVLAQGRIDEADQYATESERLAGRNLKTAIAWRAVRAEIMAARGRHDEASAMASDAVAVAAETDLVLDHADACLALSRVLAAAGDIKGANDARKDADRLYAAKEVAATVGRADESPAPAAASPIPMPSAPRPTRLTVTNRSCEFLPVFIEALRSHDVEGALAAFSDRFTYDDHRRLSGDPVVGLDAMRAALERIFEQYTHFEFRVLAVRGQRLNLLWSRWSDADGNATTTLYVNEIDDGGRVEYHGRFDEDDFETAYREIEERYYAGEGTEFAECGVAATQTPILLNRNEFDRFIAEFCTPDLHVENRSRSATPNRSAAGLLASFTDLNTLTASARTWIAATRWLSPTLSVVRIEREAVGRDGEQYAWTRILVCEHRDGRFASMCEFELEDEDAAFAYAEERMRATTSRLTVTNRASQTWDSLARALRARDPDAWVANYSEGFVYDNRRSLSGDVIHDRDALRSAVTLLMEQYNSFESRALAIRGQRLHLAWSRCCNDEGYETTHLHLHEVGDDGLIIYNGLFDEDDFESAYRELERHYYTGEGEAFADAGAVTTDWVMVLNHGDFDRLFGELTAPDYRLENRSSSIFGHRSGAEIRNSFEELRAMVTWARVWKRVVHWLSPTVAIIRLEREAVGSDGEKYAWTWLDVAEIREGRLISDCRFDLDDEQAAFAYAQERVQATTARLAVTNRASERVAVVWRALRAQDVNGAVRCYSESFSYDDHRRVSGDPIVGLDAMRTSIERVLKQYPHNEWRTLAVRGERLELHWGRMWDDSGNEAAGLQVVEVDHGGQIEYQSRYDEDDFEGAYRALEERYFGGEGAAFAEAGAVGTEFILAYNRGDFGPLLDELVAPRTRFENRSRTAFSDRSIEEFRASTEELSSMVSWARTWNSALCWLTPTWCVGRNEREAVGHDGERYSWTRIYVSEVRDGRIASSCEFDLDDEEDAFAYAEERIRATASRLTVTNRASETVDESWRAIQARDFDRAVGSYSKTFVYDDHRRICGAPVVGLDAMRTWMKRLYEQYPHVEWRTLAVRGGRLTLRWSRLWDDAGNEATSLHVFAVDHQGRIEYQGRFDEDDFVGAYSELQQRYYASEGAEFADAGATATEFATAINQGDYDRTLGELMSPDIRVENRSRSFFPDRSAAELRASFEGLDAMVASMRSWHSAECWLSPTWCVARNEREAVGLNGERYAWTRLMVLEIRNRQTTSMCVFEPDDEDAAFAYAEERMRAEPRRLAVSNRAVRTGRAVTAAVQAHDVDAAASCFAEAFVREDRRRLQGNPILDIRTAFERLLEQYNRLESRTLAVRGDRLYLGSARWWNDAGYETTHLLLHEIDESGRITSEVQFDEDDFDSAYRELERRYYAGEGAAFAEAGAIETEYMIGYNRGDFDRLLNDLTAPGMRFENRSRRAFPDRSITEFRESSEEFMSMVSSARTWNSVIYWLSPSCCLVRNEREAVGADGEQFAWTRIYVAEIQCGVVKSFCEFEIDDEEAFAYAEERARATTSRLAVANRASQTWDALWRAARARDVEAILACYAERFRYDDRRQLSGHRPDELQGAVEHILEQYTQFDDRILAVRGERLHLGSSRWSNEDGFETAYLFLHEVDDDGRFLYEGRFDQDDFDAAYRELTRRYCAGEGAAFAEGVTLAAEWMMAATEGDFDRLFGQLIDPKMRVENRSSSAFPDRSAAELHASYKELNAMVASARSWNSVECWLSPTVVVGRSEREAVGRDGERYAWVRLFAVEFCDGRAIGMCEFDVGNEVAAFAYAEERVRQAGSLDS